MPFNMRFASWCLMNIMFCILLYSSAVEATGIICYKCTVNEEISLTADKVVSSITPSCNKFDGSSKYIVQCPYSTMCMKTISMMQLQNGFTQKTIVRNCAPQKSSTLVFRNGYWQNEYTVEEVYAEKCNVFNDNILTTSTNTICYCRNDLCNNSSRIFINPMSSLPILIPLLQVFLFNYSCN